MTNYKKYIPNNSKIEIYNNIIAFEVLPSEIITIANKFHQDNYGTLKLITATDEYDKNLKVWYIFGVPKKNIFIIPYIKLNNGAKFPSLITIFPEALNYEKKIQTFFGLKSTNHPNTNPIILNENWPTNIFPLKKDFNWQTRPKIANGIYNFQKVQGEGIYEISVGPIHAGIIEPGHFRFSVAGEEIVSLEPKLGYTHKGSEKLFEQLSMKNKIHLSEKISGDSSFSHSLSFCQAIEQLSDITVPQQAQYLRVIYAELERLANHFGDIGAIMLDAGFNFGGSQGSRLREIIMQINERLTGSRFLREVNTIGGVKKNINSKEKQKIDNELNIINKDFSEIIKIAKNSISLLDRLKSTGRLSSIVAKNYNILGVAGRAVGQINDVRINYPYAAYNNLSFDKIALEQDGDVYARFKIRIKEVYTSIKLIKDALLKLSDKSTILAKTNNKFKKNYLAIGCVEGWRGEILYFITTDKNGNINRVAPRDPSFVNWCIVEDASMDNIIPDFPLINKSFNLSYSGNDL